MKSLICLCALAALFLSSALPCYANDWQITDATYVPLPVPSKQFGYVCSAYDASVCANVSDFYRFDNQTQLKVTMVGVVTPNWGVRLSLSTGAEAAKLVVDPKLIVGVVMMKQLRSGRTLSSEFSSSLGGAIRHKPCLDGYDREYFCGNLTAWSDYQNKTVVSHDYGLKVIFKY